MSMSADQLPAELIAEILTRLPTKSVCRFSCVSKTWRNVITGSPKFPKSQFSHNRLTEISLFEIVGTDPSVMELEFKSFDLIDCSSSNQLNNLSRKVQLSPAYVSTGIRIGGTCHGFICFSSLYSDEIVLVNPLTNEEDHRIFPPKNRRMGLCDLGIGYDPCSDGYKVVLMKRQRDGEIEVNIYDFISKTWRQKNFPSNYDHNYVGSCFGYYSNGALHWLLQNPGNVEDQKFVHMSVFDLVDEELKVVKYDVAGVFGYSKSTSFTLEILGGCLALCCRDDNDDVLGVEIWVMKEYGVKESWSKLASLSIYYRRNPDEALVPLAISKCGRRLLVQIRQGLWPCSSSLHWYYMDSKCFDSSIHYMRNAYGFHVCLQSLLRLTV